MRILFPKFYPTKGSTARVSDFNDVQIANNPATGFAGLQPGIGGKYY
jgi:hypothetical protein